MDINEVNNKVLELVKVFDGVPNEDVLMALANFTAKVIVHGVKNGDQEAFAEWFADLIKLGVSMAKIGGAE